MPTPHDNKRPPLVAQTRLLVLVMQYRFFWNPKLASQVPFFQTQTLLHSISVEPSQFHLHTRSAQRCGSPAPKYGTVRIEIVKVEIICDA